ncbi:MAG: hypothetical protein K5798_06095 [Nitrosopumilus sp.]|nr:hypothetical protein [Nitrosopumilus sp.]MCV0366815.1 hypothetical protein [Nitrosopumilus sp.]
MTVISILKTFLVHVALPDLGQNREAKDYGINDDVLWNPFLEATLSGT